jgi:hypothetical protein
MHRCSCPSYKQASSLFVSVQLKCAYQIHWDWYLNLLWYNEKSTLTVPWGHIDPIKKNRIKAQFITMFFSPNYILQHGLYSNIDKQTRLCLGTFEYIEVHREIYRKWITKSKNYSTTLHVWVSDYFTYSIITYRCKFYSWHWFTYITYVLSMLHERYYGVLLTPSRNKHK